MVNYFSLLIVIISFFICYYINLSKIGDLFLVVFFLVNIYQFLKYLFKERVIINKTFFWGVLIVVWYLIRLEEITKIENFLKILLLNIFFINITNINLRELKKNNTVKLILKILMGILFVILIFFNEKMSSIHVLAGYTQGLSYLYFLFFPNKAMIVFILMLIFVTNARGQILSFLLTGITYILWPKISKDKKKGVGYFYLVVISILVFMIIYMNENTILIKLNDFSQEIFNKNILSGRNKIWKFIIEKIEDDIFWGIGVGNTSKNLGVGSIIYKGRNLSTHNLYLQILIETGLIGIFLWFSWFKSIWIKYLENFKRYEVRLAAAYLIGILFSNTFELLFYSNGLSAGIVQWLVISVGMRACIKKRKRL